VNFHSLYAGINKPVATCVVGSGGFGQSFLAQVQRMKLLTARVAVDRDTATAANAFLQAGIARDRIRACSSAAEARKAWDDGHYVAADSVDAVINLPFEVLVEATGHPEAAARHALQAVEAGRHVALVSKEADSVVGPGLARIAREHGVLVTPVDGDQPSLLIAQITWAEVLGLEVIGGGKSSEYDFVFDRGSGEVTSNFVRHRLPALEQYWAPNGGGVLAASKGRAEVLGQAYALRTVPDLCELTLVANATGFTADRADLHAPVARIPEVAEFFGERGDGGLFAGQGRLDVFHNLRAPDEASFAGGVFITVRCHDKTSWKLLAEKGHVVSRSGEVAMLYLPRHLLGLEAATTILDAARLGRSGYGDDYRPRTDLVAWAERDLPAGTLLTASGHHHKIEHVAGRMVPAQPLGDDAPIPFYLAANNRLARPVAANTPIRCADVAVEPNSVLLQLRRRQDGMFRQ
jgi:predicted homoserine dehydrogenase-like protein